MGSNQKSLYHLIQKDLWETAKKTGQLYKPPTYDQDGFTHLTEDAALLIPVGNLFYKDIKGVFLVLEIDSNKLTSEVKFEAPADVGDKQTDYRRDECKQMSAFIRINQFRERYK
eukprot:TRINITY_DN9249_c0_g1_i13.p3 TRINITY_DN9249_c0_g1~~TRINITY_DN9249_c0_g1_i13.p3  ORF type:complete len:114 (+),score=12.23 TRINITY_DN9249_c0_g1_i13:23-364(+)